MSLSGFVHCQRNDAVARSSFSCFGFFSLSLNAVVATDFSVWYFVFSMELLNEGLKGLLLSVRSQLFARQRANEFSFREQVFVGAPIRFCRIRGLQPIRVGLDCRLFFAFAFG